MRDINVVCAIIKNSENAILITQRSDKSNYGKWEFPGGKVNSDETNEEALKREIFEELELKISVGNRIHYSYIKVNSLKYKLHFYECSSDSQNIILNEHLRYKWVKQNKLRNYNFLEGDEDFINTFKQ